VPCCLPIRVKCATCGMVHAGTAEDLRVRNQHPGGSEKHEDGTRSRAWTGLL